MKKKLYTKTGDDGTTWGINKSRVRKSSCNIECLGDIDELCCSISLIMNHCFNFKNSRIKYRTASVLTDLDEIQNTLLLIGSRIYLGIDIEESRIILLEGYTDIIDEENPRLDTFIYPDGENLASANTFMARAIARRAERSLWKFCEERDYYMNNMLIYLNRLSDYLFALARYISTNEETWYAN